MMACRRVVFLACAVCMATTGYAQLPTDSTDGLTFLTGTNTIRATEQATPTGSYQRFSSKITLATTALPHGSTTIGSNGTTTGSSSSSQTVTYLTGSVRTPTLLTGNFSTTRAATSSAPQPTNTTPCNNYVEFCERKYSNITMVACHNSPFTRAGSAASNQQLDVTAQLDDGVRLLQGQIQWPTNGTVPHFCHTSCDMLDAGPITDWLGKVHAWVAAHPYDVVTILLGNGNYSTPDLYAPFIESTGITRFAYAPPVQPMALADWPTLGAMVLAGRRVVMFLDYNADQRRFPWLLDEFSQLWETPFDPVDNAFPCDVQRPPALAPDAARDRMYMMNHNLNVEVSLLGASILVPAVSELNTTNAAGSGNGSLGLAAANCRAKWGRAPNFLNVDYYNYGNFPGSVFEVAAAMNNVTYNRPCCGGVRSDGFLRVKQFPSLWFLGLGWLFLFVLA